MKQKQRILNSNASTHVVAGTKYKGEPPRYFDGKKVAPGIPFVRVG